MVLWFFTTESLVGGLLGMEPHTHPAWLHKGETNVRMGTRPWGTLRCDSGSDHAVGEHRVGDALQRGDVRAGEVVTGSAVVLGGASAGVVDVAHDRS